jgi:hypothetical protein
MQTVTRQELVEIAAQKTPGVFLHVLAPDSMSGSGLAFDVSSADPQAALIVIQYMTGFEYIIGLVEEGKRAFSVTYDGDKLRAQPTVELLRHTRTLRVTN